MPCERQDGIVDTPFLAPYRLHTRRYKDRLQPHMPSVIEGKEPRQLHSWAPDSDQARGAAKLAQHGAQAVRDFRPVANAQSQSRHAFAAPFSPLHGNFQTALRRQVVTCLLIQALLIEAFAIAA